MIDLPTIARALHGEISDQQVLAPGPGHSPRDRSLAIRLSATAPDGFIAFSHAGDDWRVCRDHVRAQLGLPEWQPGDEPCGKTNGHDRTNSFVAVYDYVDENGELLFQVCRNPNKTFPQRKPDGKGGWIWKTGDVRKVLYRLPELFEAIANEQVIVIVEGEKDVENLRKIGVRATCSPGGAVKPEQKQKWRREYSESLRGASIVVIPDHDEPGYAHAEHTARMSAGIAARVRILELAKHWSECPKGGDISDWLAAGHAREELDALIEQAPDWSPREVVEASPTLGAQGAKADVPPQVNLSAAFTFLGDAPAAAPRELIKKLLPAYGIAVTGGQPSAGKTFIEMHKAVCLAKVLPFFGCKIMERVGTVFVAAEGRALMPNRFAAALAKQSITERLPIAWINQLPDFSSAAGIGLFVRQLKAMDERFQGDFGARLGQVTIDTVAARLDADCEIYGSCCVVPADGKSRFDQAATRSKGARAIQDAINEALDGQGKIIIPRADMAPIKATKVTDVRAEFDRRYVVDEADPAKVAHAKRMAFKRALDRLSPTQFGAGSAEGVDWIWKIT